MTPALRRWIAALLLSCWISIPLSAQGIVPDSSARSAAQDSLRRATVPRASNRAVMRVDTASFSPRKTKSTTTAMLLSALLPGAGQFYNESYWKVPIVTGLGIYFVSAWLDNNRRYLDYRDQYRASLASPAPNAGLEAGLLRLREFYKDQRDGFAWYFLILYVINIADAFVDASLYGFNVNEDLSINFLPGANAGPVPSPGLRMSIRFR